MSVCSVGPRVGGAAVRIGACRKAEAMSPKANPPSGNLRNGRQKNQLAERKRQLAERQPRSGACRKAEAVSPKANPPRTTPKRKAEEPTRRAATPKRCVPKSGSREPEGQLAERQSPKRKAEEPTRRGQPRSGRRKHQPAERQPRSGACRKAEAVSPKANPPSGKRRNGRQRRAVKPAGRSRETRGRRSSADTPTNTIEKRDCDTLSPSEAS